MLRPLVACVGIVLGVGSSVEALHADDNAATSYLLAVLELNRLPPDYVDSASTDDPAQGFSIRLSEEQLSYLRQPATVSVLDRVEYATSRRDCDWQRFTTTNWSDARLNDRLHGLARIALLRARSCYESEQWIAGNLDVERVRIMARHMSLQARPGEHQCFMIENMATGTAAAYILRFPNFALADLMEGHKRVGRFSPYPDILKREAERLRELSDDVERGRVEPDRLQGCVGGYFASDEDQNALGESPTELTREIRGLCVYLGELSQLLVLDHQHAEQQIRKHYERHASQNRIVAGLKGWPIDVYRENAQAICRGSMLAAIVEQLQGGSNDFSRINDPFGDGLLELRIEDKGYNLLSDLVHHSRINFRFGHAGTTNDGEPKR